MQERHIRPIALALLWRADPAFPQRGDSVSYQRDDPASSGRDDPASSGRDDPAFSQRDGSILVFEARDELKGQTYYRPLGGGIDFGEYGHAAVARELREELGAEITDIRYVATLENIFVSNGRPGHEIVLLYEARLCDPAYYAQDAFTSYEDDGSAFRVLWQPLSFFRAGLAPLYPEGLLDLLSQDEAAP